MHCFSEFGYILNDPMLEDEYFKTLAIVNTYDILNREMVWMAHLYNWMPSYGAEIDAFVWYRELATEINPKNHLPDLTIKDFLVDFMTKFNCYFDFKGKNVFIKFNNLDIIGNEITDINPKSIINIEAKTGLDLKYNLTEDEKTYKSTIDANFKISTISDASEFSALNIGDYYKQKDNNWIYKKVSSIIAESETICPNIIPFYTGDKTQYTMPVIPVYQDYTSYVLYYNNNLTHFGNLSDNVVVPYINRAVSIKPIKKWNYIYDHIENVYDSGGFLIGYIEHYAQKSVEDDERSKPTEIPQIGFYHGLADTGYGSTTGRTYPFMSNHNYKPGDLTPYGTWHLGLVGSESLTSVFWRTFLKIFDSHKRFVFNVPMNWNTAKNFKWENACMINSSKFYVQAINIELPIDGQVQIEAYEL
jgi:hypothetical protein